MFGLFGKHESGFCDFCGLRENVKHFWMDCLEFQTFQEKVGQRGFGQGNGSVSRNIVG